MRSCSRSARAAGRKAASTYCSSTTASRPAAPSQTREGAEIRITAPATPAIFAAVQAGQKWMSVEFHSVREVRTAGGVREIEQALLDGLPAITDDPEYHQTSAEVRTKKRPAPVAVAAVAAELVRRWAPAAPADVQAVAAGMVEALLLVGGSDTQQSPNRRRNDHQPRCSESGHHPALGCGGDLVLLPPTARLCDRGGGMIALDVAGGPARREVRQSTGYTNQIVNALEAAAVGGGAVAAATAAVETCAGFWGRCLALATVEPMTVRTRALTPSVLELVGRELARRGEMLFVPRVLRGRLMLLPTALTYTVTGRGGPGDVALELHAIRPGFSSATVTLPNDAVVHLHYGRSPIRPWEGRAPWQAANLSGTLLEGIERQLGNEAQAASGYIMPLPDTGDEGQTADTTDADDPRMQMRRDLAARPGRTTFLPTTRAGHGAGPMNAPEHDYQARRFGMDHPQAVGELRRDVERSILASYGLPPVFASHAAAGTSLRESWRIAIALSVAPVAELVQAQLREALDEPRLVLNLERCRAADLATLARAVGSLATAGVPVEAAIQRVFGDSP